MLKDVLLLPCLLAKYKNKKAVLVGSIEVESSVLINIKKEVRMKRYGYIFEKIIDIDNIILAHQRARRDKSHYKEVQMVDENPLFYAMKIREMLINGEYKVGKYKKSIIVDKGKERELMKLPYFPDRIIQWAIMLQIEGIFLNKFIDQTCASMPSRGIHRAWGYMQRYLKDEEGSKYCLKMDVKHFYPNIDKDILKKLLRKMFKDERLLDLLYKIIDSYPLEKGVPIGSYLSQYFGNFYLSGLDHYIKECLGCKYYVRYMDDMVILGRDKNELRFILNQIQLYLAYYLRLELKGNYQIFPTRIRGIDFVGYRFFGRYVLLRKSTCKTFKRKMRRLSRKKTFNYSDICTIFSYLGWLKFCDGFRLKRKYMEVIYERIEGC